MSSDSTFSKGNESAPVNSIAYPMQLPAVLPKLFDATCGLIHYFVRPNDEFALNSLELLDADAYLYRLLKFEGYERVAFVEVEKTNCRIWAYDALSEKIFQAADSGGLKDLMIRPSRSQPAAAGKRKGQSSIYTAEEFQKTFVAEIDLALENADHKTAVVLPMSIFEKEGFLSDVIIDTVNRLERVGNGENILVLTMPQRDDLWWCFRGKQARLHSWVNSIVTKPDRPDEVKEALRELKSRGMIVLADEYRTDEIANLLLRKKHLFQNPILAKIPDTVVYELAGRLKEHCTGARDRKFKHIPYLNRKGKCIRSLDKLLDRPEVQRELAEQAAEVPAQSVRIAYSRDLGPLLLERVYHLNLRRYESSHAMDEIMARFDEHVGEEMQQVKRAVFDAIDSIVEQKENAALTGEDGYMNMVFYGPPGTGKTTIARLTARYLHAIHILPTEKTVEKSARELVCSHIGETGEKIREAFEEAEGGVLFIDEFHGFDNAHQHGNLAQEAMGAVVAGINKHQTSVCVILAGYEDGVQSVFRFDSGANRRFLYKISFRAYSTDTLMCILEVKLKKLGRRLEPGADTLLRRMIEADKDVLREQMGNAGYLENLINRLGRPRGGEGDMYTREDIFRVFPEALAMDIKQDHGGAE